MKAQNIPFIKEYGDYEQKKAHYQFDKVAAEYDAIRWSSLSRRWSNSRKLRAIGKAIELASALNGPIKNALDIPCGTGRIFPVLFSKNIYVTGADLSLEMMQMAKGKFREVKLIDGFFRCDAVSLPFPDGRFDAVCSIRFLFHLPEDIRRMALKEMARVSRRWVIVDYRHKYTLKYRLKSLKQRLGHTKKAYHRVSRQDIAEDFQHAHLELIKVFLTFPLFSDKWVILARKI